MGKIDDGPDHSVILAVVLAVSLLFVPTGDSSAEGTPVLLDHFESGSVNATVGFQSSNSSSSSEVLISIPRGAAIIDANVSVRGIEGPSIANLTMDYSTHSVGDGLWALHEEGTTIYEPTVDPFNNTWDALPAGQVANLKSVDASYWHTQTPTTPTTAPWEYPIQLFHFGVDNENAIRHEISWRGHGACAGNTTFTKYHAELWIYNHLSSEWDPQSSYWFWDPDDIWLNTTAFANDVYVSTNGSIDVMIVGNHAEVNASGPITDFGHLYTDYIGVVTEYASTINEYPGNVTLEVYGHYMRAKDGPLDGTAVVGDAQGFKDAVQEHINSYPQQPGNVTIPIRVYVQKPTLSRVEVFDLAILYDPSGVIPNDPPAWTGPASVEVKEDSDWQPVINLDQSFTDDHDEGDLDFTIVDVSHEGALGARVRAGLLGIMWLEVRALDNYFGDVEVTVRASDSGGLSTDAPPLTVHVTQVPDPPVLLILGPVYVNESEALNLTIVVLDFDMPDDSHTFSDTSDLFDIHPTKGTIEWTPTADQIGTHSCTIRVEDSYGLFDRATLVIEVLDVNHAPRITSAGTIDVLEDQPVSYQIEAEDDDAPQGDTLTFTAWSGDATVSVGATTGLLSLTLPEDFIGGLTVFIRVEDSVGASDQMTLHVNVANVNDAPTMKELGRLSYTEGAVVTYKLVFDDPDLYQGLAEPETLSLSFEGPDWLGPDANGWVNFTADQSKVGEHLVVYTVTDREGLSASIEVVWAIANVNNDPVITTNVPGSLEVNEDEPFSLTMEATDGDGDVLTWSDSSPLFDIDPSTGVISFTPTQAHVGDHTVTVTVSDGKGASASLSFDLVVVNVNDAPVVVSVQPATGTVYKQGQLVSLSVEATDEDGDALTYYWKEGGNELGAGTPLGLRDLAVGRHTITLTVTDGKASTESTIVVEIVSSEGSGEDDELPVPVLIGMMVCIVLGVRGVMVYMKRRKGTPPEE